MDSAPSAPVLFGGGPAAWEGRESRAEESPGWEGCADEDGSRWSVGVDVAIQLAVQCRPALRGSRRRVESGVGMRRKYANAVELFSIHVSPSEP